MLICGLARSGLRLFPASALMGTRALSNAGLVRPLAAFPEGDEEAEHRWQEFASLKPKPAKDEQKWMDSLIVAKFVPVEEAPPPDAVAWHKIKLGVDQTKFMDSPTENLDNEFIHVLQLPQAIPELREQSKSLFIRGDMLELFKVARGLKRGVMIGNPGIGKSWFQWVYLLFMIRPDIYFKLSGEQQLPPFTYEDAGQSHTTRDRPKVILRATYGGKMTHVYLLEDKMVFKLGDTTAVAKLFDFRSTLLLWEPKRSRTPVLYDGLRYMQIFATVSPDTDRYKEFLKQADSLPCYMPCPSPAELLAMGRFLREHEAANGEVSFSDESIKERIHRFGPFIRCALARTQMELVDFEKERDGAIASLDLLFLVRKWGIEQTIESPAVSPWILKYLVDRNSQFPYRSLSVSFAIASQETMETIRQELWKLELGKLVDLLRENAGGKTEKLGPTLLEVLFAKHATSMAGIRWKRRECKTNSPTKNFVLKLKRVESEAVPNVSAMEPGVLYVNQFHLAGSMWKNEDGVHIVQTSIPTRHSDSLRQALKVPANQTIHLDYFPFPQHSNNGTWEGLDSKLGVIAPDFEHVEKAQDMLTQPSLPDDELSDEQKRRSNWLRERLDWDAATWAGLGLNDKQQWRDRVTHYKAYQEYVQGVETDLEKTAQELTMSLRKNMSKK